MMENGSISQIYRCQMCAPSGCFSCREQRISDFLRRATVSMRFINKGSFRCVTKRGLLFLQRVYNDLPRYLRKHGYHRVYLFL